MHNEKKHVTKYFNDVSKDYLDHKYLNANRSFMSVRQERMVDLIENHCDKSENISILDAGCGPGAFSKELAKRTNFTVTALDMSLNMIKIAMNQNDTPNKIRFIRADIEKLPLKENIFDVVATAGVIEYLDDDKKVLPEFSRILKKNGRLIISVTNKYSYNLIFDTLIDSLRKNGIMFFLMNLVNEKVLKKGKLQPKKFIIRKHSPRDFKNTVLDNKFQIIEEKYFYFMPFPHPLNLIFSFLSHKIGAKMESLSKTGLRGIGEGYMVFCRNGK